MRIFSDKQEQDLIDLLRSGAVGVLKTDTLYGIVARADDEDAVERVYTLKSRDERKSPIVLISSLDQSYDDIGATEKTLLEQVWPGPVSVILPSRNAPTWIRRGNDSVAYRLPADDDLCALINQTAPLIAPSANLEGNSPAMDIKEAMAYFADRIDFYVDEGKVADSTPSQLLRVDLNGKAERLR